MLTMPKELFGPNTVERVAADIVFAVVLPAYGLLIAAAAILHASSTSRSGLHAVWAAVAGAGTVWIYWVSTVPFVHSLGRGVSGVNLHQTVPSWALSSFEATQRFQIVASYGLFRSMTGVGRADECTGMNALKQECAGDRASKWGWGKLPPAIVKTPVVVLKGLPYGAGADDTDSGSPLAGVRDEDWIEVEFRYKPGDLYLPPRRTAPHQPRLDWQMWFAALGSYQHNPWLLSVAHRMLLGRPEMQELLDNERYPFFASDGLDGAVDKRPRLRMVKAELWHYDFTRANTSWARRVPGVEIIPSGAAAADGKGPTDPVSDPVSDPVHDPVHDPRNAYWYRSFASEYFPPIGLDDGQIGKIMNQVRLAPQPPKGRKGKGGKKASTYDPCDPKGSRARESAKARKNHNLGADERQQQRGERQQPGQGVSLFGTQLISAPAADSLLGQPTTAVAAGLAFDVEMVLTWVADLLSLHYFASPQPLCHATLAVRSASGPLRRKMGFRTRFNGSVFFLDTVIVLMAVLLVLALGLCALTRAMTATFPTHIAKGGLQDDKDDKEQKDGKQQKKEESQKEGSKTDARKKKQ
jgi:hypothetical protein